MNSRSLFSKNPDKCALSHHNPKIISIFKQALHLFSKLKKINSKLPRPPCFDGFIITISSFLELLESEKCKFILTSRLNQDPLENLFSSVRERGGFNRNPTVRLLRSTLKLLTIQQILEPPRSTSYDPDFDCLLEVSEDSNDPPPSPQESEESKNSGDSQNSASSSSGDILVSMLNVDEVVTLEECSQVYFVGYLVSKYHTKFSCNHCLELMSHSGSNLTSQELLILNRTFSNLKVDTTSGLVSPSETILNFCKVPFEIFKKKFNKICHKNKILQKLVFMTEKFPLTTCTQAWGLDISHKNP